MPPRCGRGDGGTRAPCPRRGRQPNEGSRTFDSLEPARLGPILRSKARPALDAPPRCLPGAVVETVGLALLVRGAGSDTTREAALSSPKRPGPTLRSKARPALDVPHDADASTLTPQSGRSGRPWSLTGSDVSLCIHRGETGASAAQGRRTLGVQASDVPDTASGGSRWFVRRAGGARRPPRTHRTRSSLHTACAAPSSFVKARAQPMLGRCMSSRPTPRAGAAGHHQQGGRERRRGQRPAARSRAGA